jgi:hypothetical protein
VKAIVFVNERSSHKRHVLFACLDVDASLVFHDRVRQSDKNGCEVNDCLVVRAVNKSRVLDLLRLAFNGISDTCGEVEEEILFCTLERMARSGHWTSLDEIESWFAKRGVPFTKQRWVEI